MNLNERMKQLAHTLSPEKTPGSERICLHFTLMPQTSAVFVATHLVFRIKTETEDGYVKVCRYADGRPVVAESARKLAYESVAGLFGLGELVPHTRYCSVSLPDGKEVLGTFQESSPGTPIREIPRAERAERVTPEFQRDVSRLCFLDVICHEADHGFTNYYPVLRSDGAFVSVSAFDNGDLGAFAFRSEIFLKTNRAYAPLADRQGMIRYPFVDRALAERIASVRLRSLASVLAADLGWIHIFFTLRRFQRLRRALRRSIRCGAVRLMDAQDWSQETLAAELRGDFGKTYLYALVHAPIGAAKRDPVPAEAEA